MGLMVHICSIVHKIMHTCWAPGNSDGKESATMQETQAQSLCGKNPLEKEMATHSSILVWRIAPTKEPGRLLAMGSQRIEHNCSDLACVRHPYSVCMLAYLRDTFKN